MWKSKRAKNLYQHKDNSDEKVIEITTLALASKDERVRMKLLRTLKGVDWGVASVILHFASPEEYMILDWRAVWALGLQQRSYSFKYWSLYTKTARDTAKSMGVSLRDLDKALWQFSRENQPFL